MAATRAPALPAAVLRSPNFLSNVHHLFRKGFGFLLCYCAGVARLRLPPFRRGAQPVVVPQQSAVLRSVPASALYHRSQPEEEATFFCFAICDYTPRGAIYMEAKNDEIVYHLT
ncbi:hypothetical protein KCP76_08130 [Salmonella enterica subsp. enterica serovar Weltevreden]|nr:hypothetical protein KCP76_08130 [Salmonella enterica subsp. enterica serovar Weltevreden]